ncbi:uncharacterized protein LOC111253827 [Varroa destructor]|uniref:Uncharacterized protein n=2 Tax=Varroa TaxID=62624 RepID=A0A7M7MJ40_VARDE|nr:uncharacterized protein LOC111253827 [Varroa destructor]
MPSRSRAARSSAAPSTLHAHIIKLVFFVLTFLVFVILQNSLVYFDKIWSQFRLELTGIPWWIIVLAAIGTLTIFWILFLGVDQLIMRISGHYRNDCETLSSDLESDDNSDVEEGLLQKKYSKEPLNKKAHTCSQKPSHSARSFAGKEKRPGEGHSRSQDGSQGNNYGIVQQSTGDQQGSEKKDQDSQNPTDVDVAVRPVDTTIAAGGEARVSPTYNVSLMSFSNDNAQESGYLYGSNRPYNPMYPSAPAMMQSAPACFKRSF